MEQYILDCWIEEKNRGLEWRIEEFRRKDQNMSSCLWWTDQGEIRVMLNMLDDLIERIRLEEELELRYPEPEAPSIDRVEVVEEIKVGTMTYKLEKRRCGKKECKCRRGELHGPYWYGYQRVDGKLKSKYIGKRRPF